MTHYNLGTTAAASQNTGITTGHIVHTNYHDSNRTSGSGADFRYTGTTTLAKAGNWPNADGYFYDVDGKQFEPLEIEVNALMYGARADGVTNDDAAISSMIAYCNASRKGGRCTEGSYLVNTVDLTNFAGAYFVGDSKGGTTFVSANVTGNVVSVNTGVDGSGGGINNCDIGGFKVDCSSAPLKSYGVYIDYFRRGKLFNMEVIEAPISYRIAYSWLAELEQLVSTNHTTTGFHINGNSINGITGTNLSATTTNAAAKNYNILANSLVLINPASEGTPAEGISIADGSRTVKIVGGHTEGDNTGIFSYASSSNESNIIVDGMSFFNCDNPLTMNARASNLVFSNNHIEPNTTPANVVIGVNASSFKLDGNLIEGATVAEDIDAVVFNSVTLSGEVTISRVPAQVKFGGFYMDSKIHSFVVDTAALKDIVPSRDITAGSTGEIVVTQRLSGTNTSAQAVVFQISENNVLATSALYTIGSALITSMGYNSVTKRLQFRANFAGSVSIRLKVTEDSV